VVHGSNALTREDNNLVSLMDCLESEGTRTADLARRLRARF
jgi:hypothetical protein